MTELSDRLKVECTSDFLDKIKITDTSGEYILKKYEIGRLPNVTEMLPSTSFPLLILANIVTLDRQNSIHYWYFDNKATCQAHVLETQNPAKPGCVVRTEDKDIRALAADKKFLQSSLARIGHEEQSLGYSNLYTLLYRIVETL